MGSDTVTAMLPCVGLVQCDLEKTLDQAVKGEAC